MSLASSPGLFGIFITASRPASAHRWQTSRAALSPARLASSSLSAMIVRHSMPARTGNALQLRRRASRPHRAEAHPQVDIADSADSIPSQICSPSQHLVVGRQADDPQPSDAAERLRLADLAALVDVGPGDPAGALAGDRIGQDRDDGAEPLAVEFVERALAGLAD